MWRADTTNQDNKYRTPREKLIHLEANDWPTFKEHLKNLHPAEFYQVPTLQQVGNGERCNAVVQIKTHVGSTTSTSTTPPKSAKSPAKQPLHKSLIRPPKNIKDRLKTCLPKDLNNLNKNHKLSLAKLGKYRWKPKWTREDQEAHSKCPQEQGRL